MFTYLLQSSACLIILYGIYHFVLAEMTFFKYNRAYLLISIAVSLVLPLLAPLLVLSEDSIPVLHWSHIAEDVNFVISESKSDAFDWRSLGINALWAIYIAGVLAVFIKMVYGITKIYGYYTHGQKEKFNGYQIITTEAVHLPFSFFNGIYVSRHVPLQDHIHTIIEHEEIHIRQWHTVDVLMAEMVHAFFWFNPVLIFYKRALRQAHEYLADDLICRNSSVSSYTNLLLSKSQSGIEMALTNQFFHSQIKKRIIMMTKNKSNAMSIWKYALSIPVILLLLITFSCKESENQTTNQADNKEATLVPHKSEDKDYTDLDKNNALVRAEEMPRFPGCEDINDTKERSKCAEQKLLEYIYKNLKYPAEARQAGIQGQCVAKFIVNTEGKIQDIRILRDVGGGCGKAVRSVILFMNEMTERWIPGKNAGQNVNVVYTLPVKFSLADDDKSLGVNAPVKSHNQHDAKSLEKSMVSSFKKGDVIIKSGKKELIEDVDFAVDYKTGNLKILNTEYSQSSIDVSFKNNKYQQNGKESHKLGNDEGYYQDQKGKPQEITDALFNKENPNKPLFLIDGKESDISILYNHKFEASNVVIMMPSMAMEKYGDKGKYGAFELIEPVFTLK